MAERPRSNRPRRMRSSAAGSVLLLFPALVLVLVALAAITVDAAVVAEDQRDLVAVAEAAANDAAAAVDVEALRSDGDVRLDPARAERAVHRAVSLADGSIQVRWTISDTTVEVELRRQVRLVFAPAIPGAPTTRTVVAHASADLRRR